MAKPKKGAKKYWVGLFIILKDGCDYYNKWKTYLPSDLPTEVKTAVTAIDLACDAIIAYDKAHKGGKY